MTCALAGIATLPLGSNFPGTDQQASATPKSSKPVYFATAGEKGAIKIWRSDSGACVYQKAISDTPFSTDELLDLMLLPGGAGLMACTADARLLFYSVQVRMCVLAADELLTVQAALLLTCYLAAVARAWLTMFRIMQPANDAICYAVSTSSFPRFPYY